MAKLFYFAVLMSIFSQASCKKDNSSKKDDNTPPESENAVPSDISAIRSSIGDLSQYDEILEKSEKLEPIELGLGKSISKEECLEIKEKIIKLYDAHPFELTTHNGSITSRRCVNVQGLYLISEKVEIQNGQSAAYVLQEQTFETYRKNTTSLFLDANFKVLGSQTVSQLRNQDTVMGFNVATLQADGLYIKDTTFKLVSESKGITGPEIRTSFLPADGSFDEIIKIKHQDSEDESLNAVLYSITKATQSDWTAFELLPTFGDFGSVYKYDNEFHKEPKSNIGLLLKFKSGAEVCAVAYVRENGNFKSVGDNLGC